MPASRERETPAASIVTDPTARTMESCVKTSRPVPLAVGLLLAASAGAFAQAPQQANSKPSNNGWVAPGTKGSPIDGTAFHAQVLLDAAGFSPGPIDGKKGSSLQQAVRGFQEARGLKTSGQLDQARCDGSREARLSCKRRGPVRRRSSRSCRQAACRDRRS